MVQFAKHEMVEYLGRIGYEVCPSLAARQSYSTSTPLIKPEDLNRLNVIHVTGTKGKGSTCAFVDSILRKTVPDWKIGKHKQSSTTSH
jgi:folylpolyglutamate synthase